MMPRTLAGVARAVDGRLVGADVPFGAVATDTRNLPHHALFVALRGERFDGHDFLGAAAQRGAAGALVSAETDSPLPQVRVEDTRRALGRMANVWRGNFSVPVVAVTGSSGKTTVKELIASILGVGHRVCATEGNLNNDIGVPLTLMRLEQSHEALVVELGANHAGEIGYLASLVEPTVGVITNAGAAHLEGFGSVAGVAAAKGELLDHLPRAGTAVLNADDPFFSDWRTRSRAAQVISFGLHRPADVAVVGAPAFDAGGSHFVLRLPDRTEAAVKLPLLGMHSVLNALAAAAAAHAVGVSTEQIAAGLSRAAAVHGRLDRVRGRKGALVIDDSYNANPSSVRAALDTLAALPGKRIFVLGDMAELGPDAAKLHRETGAYAVGRCDELVTIGPLAGEAAQSFGAGARPFGDVESAAAALEPLLGEGVTVLVKASRVMGLDRVVAALAAADDGRGPAQC
ncbi:MAG TPA: UDP-N-acetylmuramoyl-tripeptide--D-alanyl-D-alanine ligase [Gammaproteobacteria bacterium]|nr:UDP-N-acetylmuramoyl-tripeptide--D-alanyl-D-alanine ligase [Gammaproteobacteria bacterium]